MSSLDFERDLTLLVAMAHGLYLPDPASPVAVIPQFDGYFNLEDVPSSRMSTWSLPAFTS